jgi:hypothetical protein
MSGDFTSVGGWDLMSVWKSVGCLVIMMIVKGW